MKRLALLLPAVHEAHRHRRRAGRLGRLGRLVRRLGRPLELFLCVRLAVRPLLARRDRVVVEGAALAEELVGLTRAMAVPARRGDGHADATTSTSPSASATCAGFSRSATRRTSCSTLHLFGAPEPFLAECDGYLHPNPGSVGRELREAAVVECDHREPPHAAALLDRDLLGVDLREDRDGVLYAELRAAVPVALDRVRHERAADLRRPPLEELEPNPTGEPVEEVLGRGPGVEVGGKVVERRDDGREDFVESVGEPPDEAAGVPRGRVRLAVQRRQAAREGCRRRELAVDVPPRCDRAHRSSTNT